LGLVAALTSQFGVVRATTNMQFKKCTQDGMRMRHQN